MKYQAKKMPISYGRVHLPWTLIGKGTTRPELSRLKAVEMDPVPTTKKEVPSFSGLTGDYRRFIPNYATIAKLLTDLTEKCTRKNSMECDMSRSFSDIETDITNQSVRNPDFSKVFTSD